MRWGLLLMPLLDQSMKMPVLLSTESRSVFFWRRSVWHHPNLSFVKLLLSTSEIRQLLLMLPNVSPQDYSHTVTVLSTPRARTEPPPHSAKAYIEGTRLLYDLSCSVGSKLTSNMQMWCGAAVFFEAQ